MRPEFSNKLGIMTFESSNLLVDSLNTQVKFSSLLQRSDGCLTEWGNKKISFVPLTCSCFPSDDKNSLLVVLWTTLSDTQLDLRATARSSPLIWRHLKSYQMLPASPWLRWYVSLPCWINSVWPWGGSEVRQAEHRRSKVFPCTYTPLHRGVCTRAYLANITVNP